MADFFRTGLDGRWGMGMGMGSGYSFASPMSGYYHQVSVSTTHYAPMLTRLLADGADVVPVHVALLNVHGEHELHGGRDAAASLSLQPRLKLFTRDKWTRKFYGELIEIVKIY